MCMYSAYRNSTDIDIESGGGCGADSMSIGMLGLCLLRILQTVELIPPSAS